VAYERDKSIVDAKDVYEATQRMGMITDVFHYIILLNNQERKIQESDPATDSPAQESAPSVPPVSPMPERTRTVPPHASEPVQKTTREVVNEIPGIPREKIDISEQSYDDIAQVIKAKYDQKGLKISIGLFLLSIIVFIGSIFFFCHRSDSSGILDCLRNLLNF
jgi:general secretion pathway protein A